MQIHKAKLESHANTHPNHTSSPTSFLSPNQMLRMLLPMNAGRRGGGGRGGGRREPRRDPGDHGLTLNEAITSPEVRLGYVCAS
eukprot:808904-Amorphochlora_amoeboformis.AAC.1